MKNLTLILAAILSMMLTGYAPKSGAKTPVAKNPQTLETEKKLREQEEARQDQKDRERVLRKKQQMEFARQPSPRSNPQTKRIELVNPVQASALNDKDLYSELVGSFDRNDEIAFFPRFQAFTEKYSKSPLADDAYYLAGLMSLSNKNYGPALRYFNQILQKYPLSNKSSSALFAKGVTLKKLNLNEESRNVFAKVRKNYPGSPEARRAQTELKIMAQ